MTPRRLWPVGLMVLALLAGAVPAGSPAAQAAEPKQAPEHPQVTVASASTTVTAVSAGFGFTCAVRADGTIGCWGYEEFGEATPPDGTFTAVATGGWHTCAIRTDGTLTCWGNDSQGQATPPTGTFTSVSAGMHHACAIRTDGTLACWGANDHFQATPPAGTYTSVSAGSEHTCATATDGTLACWGADDENQATPPSGDFTVVEAGGSHACAIRADGTLACWGYNGANMSIPPSGTFIALGVGDEHACAIRTAGTMTCWGANPDGRATAPTGTFKAVSGGVWHTCAIRTDDTLTCFGDDEYGEVTPRPTARVDALPEWATSTSATLAWRGSAALAPIATYDVRYRRATWNGALGANTMLRTATTETQAALDLSAGYTYCYSVQARDADGLTSAWSYPTCTAVPIDDRSLTRAGSWALGTGNDHFAGTELTSTTSGASLRRTGFNALSIALLVTVCPTCGSVALYRDASTTPFRTISLASPVTIERKLIPLWRGWEEEEDYFLGTLTIKVASSGKPVTVDGLVASRQEVAPVWADATDPPQPAIATTDHKVLAVDAGDRTTCAILADGTLACWGSNTRGVAIPPTGTFTAVGVGGGSACAIRTDGSLACWGRPEYGDALTPPDGSFTAVSVGEESACAIRSDGTLACWGSGYGDEEEEPISVPSGAFVALAGDDDFCAIRPDGTVACWGYSYMWGEGVTPSGMFTALDGGCGLRTDGTVTCWDGTTPPDGTFDAIAFGWLHACGLKADGTVACSGDNEYLESQAPTGTFRAISADGRHTCAIRTDDTLACWGQNSSGQVAMRPVVAMKTLATWLSTRSIALSWRGSALAGMTSYDVRYRRAPRNAGFGSYTTWRGGTTAETGTVTGSAGYTYCFSARARDSHGITTSWTSETCTAVPLDDRSLTRSGSWTAGTGSSYYGSTYLRSSTMGATLTRTGIAAKRIALLVTTCPTCGSVKVYLGSTYLKTINLYSGTTVNRKLITVKSYSSVHSGTLKIKVVSSGKKVIIDGVALRRN